LSKLNELLKVVEKNVESRGLRGYRLPKGDKLHPVMKHPPGDVETMYPTEPLGKYYAKDIKDIDRLIGGTGKPYSTTREAFKSIGYKDDPELSKFANVSKNVERVDVHPEAKVLDASHPEQWKQTLETFKQTLNPKDQKHWEDMVNVSFGNSAEDKVYDKIWEVGMMKLQKRFTHWLKKQHDVVLFPDVVTGQNDAVQLVLLNPGKATGSIRDIMGKGMVKKVLGVGGIFTAASALSSSKGEAMEGPSVKVVVNDQEMELPLMVPTLSKDQRDYLSVGGKPTEGIMQKVLAYAGVQGIPEVQEEPTEEAEAQSAIKPEAEAEVDEDRVIYMDDLLEEEEDPLTTVDLDEADEQVQADEEERSIVMAEDDPPVIPQPTPGAEIPEDIRQAYKERTGQDAPALYPEEEEKTNLWVDLAKGLGYGIAAVGLAAGAAALTPVAGGALGVGALGAGIYGAMQATDALVTGGEVEKSITEELGAGPFPTPVSEAVKFGENTVLFGGLRAGKQILKGVGMVKQKTIGGPAKTIEPLGEWLWDNAVLPLTKVPIPGMKKSVREIIQPGVERLAGSKLLKERQAASTIRKAEVQKSLTTGLGRQLSKEVQSLLPSEQYEVLKGLRGSPASTLTSSKAVDFLTRADNAITDLHLDNLYEREFRKSLSKALTKPVEEIEGSFSHSDILAFLSPLEKGLPKGASVKQVHKAMREVIENPNASDEIKTFMKDMWNVPVQGPLAVVDASREASTAYMTQKFIANRGLLKAPGAKNIPSNYIKSDWGQFKGLMIPRDLEFQLQAISTIPRIARGVYQKWFLSPWKMSKTILRPAYHARNLISNLILNDWGGLPFYRADVYMRAMKEMRKGTGEWKKFVEKTGLAGNFTQNDLYQMEAGLKYGADMFDKAYNVFEKIVRPAKTLQNAEESMFKFAKYLHNRELGMDAAEAALDSQKYVFNYGEVTTEMAQFRKYVAPFATWSSKVIPLMAETAVKHPLRFGKWLAFGAALQGYAMDQTGVTEEEWAGIEQNLPMYVKKGVFLLAPWRDEQERLNLINLTYIMPGIGDVNEMWNTLTPSTGGGGGLQVPNPVISILGALASKTKYSGAPLYYDWEDPSTKMAKTFSYLWEQLTPAVAPGGTDWNTMYHTMIGQPGALSPEAAFASSFGIKVLPVDEKENIRRKDAMRKLYASEAQLQMIRELRLATDPDEKDDIKLKYRELRREIPEM